MKTKFCFLVLICLSLSTLAQPTVVILNTSKVQNIDLSPDSLLMEQFRQNTVTWMKAYNSGDAANLSPLYTEDAQYISGHVKGLVADGRDKVLAYFQAGMSGGGHIDSIEILTANVSCYLATLFCRYHATNSGTEAIGRNLLVLRKVGGIWLISIHMTVI